MPLLVMTKVTNRRPRLRERRTKKANQLQRGLACETRPPFAMEKASSKRRAHTTGVEAGISRHIDGLRASLTRDLGVIGRRVAARLKKEWPALEKADRRGRAKKMVARAVKDQDFTLLQRPLTKELKAQFKRAGVQSLVTLRLPLDDSIVDEMDPRAVEYANARAAELVGRRKVKGPDGKTRLVNNPNKQWSISSSTRDLLRATVERGLERGISSQALADEITNSFAFSDARAMAIARTELAFAHVAGHTDVARELGAVAKRSILGSEHAADVPQGCICDDAAERGVIAFGDEFVPGMLAAPFHPHCVCDVVYYYEGDPEAEKFGKLAKSTIDDGAHVACTSPMNLLAGPTTPQQDAGNYKMGHVVIAGLQISIENPIGSRRKPKWPVLRAHYGYIRRTVGADGDQLDVFVREYIKPDYDGMVWVVYQVKEDGSFDEHKVMLGWPSEPQAREAYLMNYAPGWKCGEIRGFTLDEFKVWMRAPDIPTTTA